ncbi:MAG TPA: CRTAC1 family protein [Acidimicrobiia bacterium]
MTPSQHGSAFKSLLILLSGVLVGGLATGAVILGIIDVVRETPTEDLGAPTFVEESDDDGIDQIYAGEFQFFVGGGVAVFDCNEDHFPDLYIAGGSQSAGLYLNGSEDGGPLRFDRVTSLVTDLNDVTGAYPIDVDSDGITDLAVLRVGENVMLRGTGDCVFEPANDHWEIDGGDEWTAAFSAVWEEGQSLPTIAFGNYLALTRSGARDECEDHYLFRPDGTTYKEPVILSPGFCTLSILFSDWSRRGNRDLRMTNDRHYYREGQEQLWRVEPGEAPRLYTGDDGWQTMQIWGMGIASHDLTGDGLPEVFLTSQGDNKLQTVSDGARPAYEDIALEVGATAHRPFLGDTNQPSTAWHAEFGDVNNDGFVDIFVTKGNVDAQTDFAMEDPNNLLLGQSDGTFLEGAEEAGLIDYARSRGGALADLNRDGLLDVVVAERRQPASVWRNMGDAGNWLAVDVQQPAPNSDAIGAWMELRSNNSTISAEITIGGGHAGGELGPVHFGLGQADSVELRVIWPDGERSRWMSTEANQTVVVKRGSGGVSILSPLQD